MKPKAAIRRFDVFAEYNRQTKVKEGTPPPEAKGYGLWLAKVVAARRFGPGKAKSKSEAEERKARSRKWRSLDGKPQTDKLFDKEIVQRMGRDFYKQVFVPAIEEAVANGNTYIQIRDAIRRDWKPEGDSKKA